MCIRDSAIREGRADSRQLVERAAIPPAHELGTRALLEDLERPDERLLQRPLAQPEDALALAHLHVTELRTNRGRHAVSYTHLRAHETVLDLVCRLLLEKK